MKKQLVISGISTSILLLTGCASTTIFDPATTKTEVRQIGTVSSEEMREVTAAAVNSAMSNAKFNTFLKKYKQEKNDIDAIPVVKLDWVVNDTDDPDLNVSEITDMINEALINAGKVDVTLAEGTDSTATIALSRELKNDANFDQSTVAKSGTLQAARLIFRPKITSNIVTDGGKKVIVRTFVMDMADIKTGLVMWRYTKQLGFIKESGIFGW